MIHLVEPGWGGASDHTKSRWAGARGRQEASDTSYSEFRTSSPGFVPGRWSASPRRWHSRPIERDNHNDHIPRSTRLRLWPPLPRAPFQTTLIGFYMKIHESQLHVSGTCMKQINESVVVSEEHERLPGEIRNSSLKLRRPVWRAHARRRRPVWLLWSTGRYSNKQLSPQVSCH